MPYGTANVDVIQSSVANTPVQFNDGNGTQIGTLCRAWVNFNGTSGASPVIRSSFNISSVTRNSTGDYTINFATSMTDSNYSIVGAGYANTGVSYTGIQVLTLTASSARIQTWYAASNVYDAAIVPVAIFR